MSRGQKPDSSSRGSVPGATPQDRALSPQRGLECYKMTI